MTVGFDTRLGRQPVSMPGGGLRHYLSLPSGSGNYASTPDAADLSITGDIDIRALIAPNDWTPAALFAVVAKWQNAVGLLSYFLGINPASTLSFFWSPVGTGSLNATSTAAMAFTDGQPGWIRVILDVNNGAAGKDIKFYTGPTGAGAVGLLADSVDWTQLGTTVTQATPTAIHDNASAVELGSDLIGTTALWAGKLYYAEIRNGIGGTVVAAVDLRRRSPGTTSFADPQGHTWTVNGTAAVV